MMGQWIGQGVVGCESAFPHNAQANVCETKIGEDLGLALGSASRLLEVATCCADDLGGIDYPSPPEQDEKDKPRQTIKSMVHELNQLLVKLENQMVRIRGAI